MLPPVPRQLPERFAVMPFENRDGIGAMDWMSAGVPIALADKVDRHLGWAPGYDELVLPAGVQPVPPTPENVAAFAEGKDLRWVWTGWVRRPNWDLQLGVALWSIEEGMATRIGEVVGRAQFAEVHRLIGDAVAGLADRARVRLSPEAAAALRVAPTRDFYAFTLFGRGMATWLGTVGEPDLPAATKDLTRSVFIDPKHVAAQRIVGELHLRAGKDAKARGRFAYALELEPDYYPALRAYARWTQAHQKLEHARELYAQMLGQRPWDLTARYELGRVLWQDGDADAAFEQLTQVVERRPEHIGARRVLVLIHAARGDNTDLVRELEAVARLDPDDVEVKVDLGAAYTAVGARDQAIKTYESVIASDPGNAQVQKFLGDLYRRGGRFDDAARAYTSALDANPDDPRSYFLLGATLVQAGEDGAAKRVYRRAQRFRQYLPEIYNNLGAISYRQGRYNESIWYLQRAVIKNPTSARYRYNFALSLSSARDPDLALEQVDIGLRLAPENAELHYLRGVIHLRQGRVDAAEKSFEQTLALRPNHEDALHNITLIQEMQRTIEQGEVVREGRR